MRKTLKRVLMMMLVIGVVAGVYTRPNRPGNGGTGTNSVVETEESAEI